MPEAAPARRAKPRGSTAPAPHFGSHPECVPYMSGCSLVSETVTIVKRVADAGTRRAAAAAFGPADETDHGIKTILPTLFLDCKSSWAWRACANASRAPIRGRMTLRCKRSMSVAISSLISARLVFTR